MLILTKISNLFETLVKLDMFLLNNKKYKNEEIEKTRLFQFAYYENLNVYMYIFIILYNSNTADDN